MSTALQRLIFEAALHLVATLVIKDAIHQVTVFVIPILLVVNMSSGLVDIVGPPIVPLKILCDVSMKRIVRNVGFFMVEIFEDLFCWCFEILLKNDIPIQVQLPLWRRQLNHNIHWWKVPQILQSFASELGF